MADAAKNFAKVTLSQGYDSAAVSVALLSGEGDLLPDPAVDGEFNLVWWNFTDYLDPSDDASAEIVRCTAKTSDTLTITRAQEGTTATSKNITGKTYKMILAFTKKTYEDLQPQLGTPTGDIDGVNDTYTIPDADPTTFLYFRNGQLQEETTQYTLSGNTLTAIPALEAGENPEKHNYFYFK